MRVKRSRAGAHGLHDRKYPMRKNSAASDSIHCGAEKAQGFGSRDAAIAGQQLELALGELKIAGKCFAGVGICALGDELASSLELRRFAIQQVLPDLGAMRAEEFYVLEDEILYLETRIADLNHVLDAAGETRAATFYAETDAVLLDRVDKVRDVHPITRSLTENLRLEFCDAC
jgi:hypothetical protein